MRSKALEKAQHRIEACRSQFPTRFPGCAHPTTVPSCAGSKERHRSAQTCTKARSENVRQIAWRNAAGLDAPLHRGIEPPSSRAQRNGLPMLATKADEAGASLSVLNKRMKRPWEPYPCCGALREKGLKEGQPDAIGR